MVESQRIVFLHLQKTGGTAIFEALKSHFAPDEVCPERFDLLRWSQASLSQFRLFAGHFAYDTLEHIPGSKLVITILREPRERLLSHFRFVKRHRRDYLAATNPLLVPVKDMTLAEYILAGTPSYQLITVQIGGHSFFRTLTRLWSMHAIGFFDDLDQSRRAIWRRLGLPEPNTPLARVNVTASLIGGAFEEEPEADEVPDAETARLVNEVTRQERIIYASVRWFSRRLTALE
jgi:hypothetical protein